MTRRFQNTTKKPGKMASVWQYLDDQLAKNQPASSNEFFTSHPDFNPETYHKAVAAWGRARQDDPKATEWFDGVRLKKDTILAAVRKFLDKRFAGNESGTSADYRKKHPAIAISTFNSGAFTWQKMHASDLTAMKWYNEIRLGRLNRSELKRRGIPTYQKLVNEFLEERFAKNKPAKSEEFFALYPHLVRSTFYHDIYKWQDQHTGDPAAVKWFNEVRMGELSGPEAARRGIPTQADIVRQYNDEHFANNATSKYTDFHQLHPEVSDRSFHTTSFLWRDEHANDPAATDWFNNARTGGPTQKDLVINFQDQQFAKNAPVKWSVFKKLYPKISFTTLAKGASKWKKTHTNDPVAMEWFDNVRLGRAAGAIRRYLDWQCATNEPASCTHAGTLFPHVCQQTYKKVWDEWRREHGDEEDLQDWITSVTQLKPWSSKMGHLFEHNLVATLYPHLRDRGILLHYNTAGIAEVGKHQEPLGKNSKQKRARLVNRARHNLRVEMRFFSRDLLASTSGIGPALRKFLQENGRPHVAVDLTLGEEYGEKITKYADEVTNLLVVNPRGNYGQRTLETNVRVLGLREFLGTEWLNVDYATREVLAGDLKTAYAALRGGPASNAWQQLKRRVDSRWAPVKEALKADGSQARYQARVAEDVANALKTGHVPDELVAYAEAMRAGGFGAHAGRIEELAKALAALARVTRCEQLPDQPPKYEHPQRDSLAEGNREKGSASGPEVDAREFASTLQQAGETDPARIEKKIDPNRLAEAREFAKAIQEARETEGRRETVNIAKNDHQRAGKNLDPARLTEAREFAKAIQDARNESATREKKGIDPTRLAEAQECARQLQAARDADSARADKQPPPEVRAKDISRRTQEDPRQTPPERPAEPGRETHAF